MALYAPIELSGEDRQKCSFAMPAKATKLNRHGAAVPLNRELLVGSIVLVRNKRGTQVSARVVAQLAAVKGVSTYAIEFVEMDDKASNFWGITVRRTPTNQAPASRVLWIGFGRNQLDLRFFRAAWRSRGVGSIHVIDMNRAV